MPIKASYEYFWVPNMYYMATGPSVFAFKFSWLLGLELGFKGLGFRV